MVEECLPPGLMKAVVSKNKAISNGKLRLHTFANTSPQEQELFRAAYADKSMSLAQRERLSAAILQGDYSVVSPKSTSTSESEVRVAKLRARDSAHRYRHEYNSGGLGVVSKSAALLPPEMKEKKAEQIKRCQSLGKGDMAYRWNRSQVPTVPVHVPPANHTLGQLSSQQFEVPEDYTSRKAAQEYAHFTMPVAYLILILSDFVAGCTKREERRKLGSYATSPATGIPNTRKHAENKLYIDEK